MVVRYKGIPSVFGQMASTLSSFVMSAAGTFTPGITGTFASTLGAFTMSASGSAGQPISSSDVATVTVTNEAAVLRSNWPVTFGHYFKKGDVASTATVGVKIGSTAIACDVIHKATYSDGSLKHAIITAVIPTLSASASQALTIYTQSVPGAGSPITKASILATAFDAVASCTISGTTYSLTARELLDGTTARTLDLTWLSGANCSEFIVGGRLKAGAVTHAHLCAYFHVRAYGSVSSVTKVRCDVVVENGWTFTAGAGLIAYIPSISVGGVVVWDNGGASYNHYHHSRLHRRGWWGTDTQVRTALNAAYLKSSKGTFNYGSPAPTSGVLDGFLSYTPGSNVNLRTNWGDTGYHPQIGPMPQWDAAYVKSGGDSRALNGVVNNALAGGSYSYHYRDENTGYPPSLDTYPNLCESEQTGGIVIGTGGVGHSHEPGADPNAHQPLLGYLAYLITGDYVHLEELQFLANYNMVWTARASRAAGTGNNAYGVPGLQMRGRAWGLRTLAHCAAITPDAHALKSYFVSKVNNCITHYTSTYATVGGANYNVLGAIQDYDWPTQYSPWQSDFFTSVFCRLNELDFASSSTLQTWSARWPTGRMGQPGIGNGYCRFYATNYNFSSGIVQSGGAYNTSFAQLYTEQWNLACTPPGPNATAGWMHTDALPNVNSGYFSNMRPALAMAVDAGVANPITFRQYEVMGVTDYTTAPEWDITPRFTIPAAIAALAAGQWYQFPSSNASVVDPCPGGGCNYQGSDGFPDIMAGWSGGAYDIKRDRLTLWGGGHGGYYGNLVIAFDVIAGQWSRLSEPSTIVSGDLAPPNTTAYYADGKPSARHTYNYLQYVPETDSLMSLITGGTSGGSGVFGTWADKFNLATNTWSPAGTIPNVPEQSGENEIGAFSAIDAFGNCWVHTSTSGSNRLYKYVPSTNTWTAHTQFVRGYYPSQGCTAAVDTKRNRMVTVGADNDGHMFYRWDLNNPNTAPVALTGFPAALNADIAPGFDYDPIGDRFLAWNGGQTVHVLNASTLVWSTLSVSGVTPSAANARGTYGRFRYVPSLHGFILVNTTAGSVYFLKL